jgi:hypothetical protein
MYLLFYFLLAIVYNVTGFRLLEKKCKHMYWVPKHMRLYLSFTEREEVKRRAPMGAILQPSNHTRQN